MAFTKRAAEIWRDFVVPLNPLSGLWLPPKADIRLLLTEIEDQVDEKVDAATVDELIGAAIAASGSSGIAFQTLAEANANLGYAAKHRPGRRRSSGR
jgi:hypothetical protein